MSKLGWDYRSLQCWLGLGHRTVLAVSCHSKYLGCKLSQAARQARLVQSSPAPARAQNKCNEGVKRICYL